MPAIYLPPLSRLSIVLAATLTLGACANLKSLTDNMRMLVGKSVQFVEPAKSNELNQVSAIAIVAAKTSATGTNAAPLVSVVQSRLLDLRIGGASYFKQVQLGPAPTDAPTDLKWAELELDLLRFDVRDESTVEKRFRCPGDGTFRKCKSEEAQHYTVNCRSRIATAGATLTAKEPARGSLLASRNLVKQADSTICSDQEGGNLASADSLRQAALTRLSEALLEGLTPTLVKRPLDLIDEDDALQGQDAALVELSYQMAAEGQVETARDNYLLLLQRFPNQSSLLFNVGYCEQALGNFAKARQYYEKAAQGANPPRDMLEKYRQETDTWLARGYQQVSL